MYKKLARIGMEILLFHVFISMVYVPVLDAHACNMCDMAC